MLLTILKKDLETLASVRCINGLMAAVDGEYIWLRGNDTIAESNAVIRHLPVKQRFHLDENDLLFPSGMVTPTGKLKEMNWQSLQELIPVQLPVSTGVGENPSSVDLRLQPSSRVHKSAGLLTDLAIWRYYGETAPVVRLNALKFAVSENKKVMIIGDLLPSIPGREYWNCHGMMLPAGFEFELEVVTSFLPQQLNGNGDALIVFDTNGEWHQIDHNFFIPATRSAIRMTMMNEE
ncbi:hypothetical protein LZZ85_00020 [Terrimonas sp. NA20]|uniref:MoxR-vWA-beta-propeller ternary system domain-containing protein n=1 Tax=Terrimonas ginsenosidimutans TaxID=2908004 RepID=A0ABS9KJY0_9BACT|nr:hypothetical protein [Terrimonas ginsenosidimutans]MCG2612634.1 hypothetical protein [Terrimonas ginsenosidimutans]